mmetsp:Transcript_32549/g.52745  ORF Transcript_32549/g.52745 Transcript_32549/m.52745 type:complete len:497 (+) Transcript_32549:51-1541(+)
MGTETESKTRKRALEDDEPQKDSKITVSFPASEVCVEESKNNEPQGENPAAVLKPQRVGASSEVNTDLMRFYYRRLFPYKHVFRWLSYGKGGTADAEGALDEKSDFFSQREFAFTLDNGREEMFLRYQSFASAKEMQDQMIDKCPSRFEIGAIFNMPPSRRTFVDAAVFKPLQKELVFDIDMTDYDDVRRCCSGADVCRRCWPFITAAIQVLDRGLRQDFGFQHLLYVFSGRRGVHCWVADPRARRLANDGRSAVAEYFSVYKGSENNSSRKVSLTYPLHPSLQMAYDQILVKTFESLLESQGYLDDPAGWEKILAMLPDEEIRMRLHEKWLAAPGKSSRFRWSELKATAEATAKSLGRSNMEKQRGWLLAIEEIVFAYTYPRLDINVSKQLNHLLKGPFCIHPKTGRVCVPIDASEASMFDPAAVPTLQQLFAEYEKTAKDASAESDQQDSSSRKGRDEYKRTSLKAAVDLFCDFLVPLERACRAQASADAPLAW